MAAADVAAAESPGAAGVLVAVIGLCECAYLVRCAYAWWLMNHRRQQSAASGRSDYASSASSSVSRSTASEAAATAAIEECWQHINYADVYGDATAAATQRAETADAGSPPERPKCSLLELTERLQREPMADEIIEYVDVSMIDDGGAPLVDGRRSSEMIGAQLIAEAGLVFSCSSLSALTPGTCFNISGHTAPNCERFSVNLLAPPKSRSSSSSGRGREPDIALHINPRLPQNYIVRNCRVAGSWGTEEVTSPMPFRLRRGAPFAMQLLVTEADYYLSVDGEHFASFRHRLPYGKVTALQVCGDVIDVQVDQLSILGYPETLGRTPTVEVVGAEQVREETERMMAAVAAANGVAGSVGEALLDLPYYGRLPAPLAVGQTLHIYGSVKLLPHSFYVNLQHGQHIWPHPVIAFHLNPRFASVGASNVICRNSWYAGRWDREQRSAIHTEFMPSRRFHMTISVEADRYLVSVNGKCITEYAHRVEVGNVDTVLVQGDIRLQHVWLELSGGGA